MGKSKDIPRTAYAELLRLASLFPVVTLLGPRQAGKTTLAKWAFPGYRYINLEDMENRRLAEKDPKGFFSIFPPPIILDEVQRVPDLLSTVQVLCDARKDRGAFILTGSNQPLLSQAISQSLAGRTAILKLLPLSLEELGAAGIHLGRDRAIHAGFLPRLHADKIDPPTLYRAWYETYLERDLRQILQIKNLSAFDAFMRLLAGRVGQLVNLDALGRDSGVSAPTIREWLSALEATFLIIRLPPFHENFGKRLVRSAKIYFTEPGLAAWLIGIERQGQVARDPLMGNLFENVCVIEAFKARLHRGRDPHFYHFRDHNGIEVDLLHERRPDLIPMEIKASMTWSEDFSDGIRALARLSPKIGRGAVAYAGDLRAPRDRFDIVPFQNLGSLFVD